jgi:RNA polymerase sigma-70 factor (ECF subfamily)
MAPEPAPDGEDPKIAAVLDEYGRFLRQTLVRLCPRNLGLQVDDIEQDARIRLWKALQGERTIENLASYIYRVAANAAVDAIRRTKVRREQPLEPEDAEGDPLPEASARVSADGERALDRRLLLEKVEGVLGQLETKRVQVVRLHLQGFTTSEMARLLGLTEPAARNLLHRALRELRQRLQDSGVHYAGD